MDYKSNFRRTLADPPDGPTPSFQTRSSATQTLLVSLWLVFISFLLPEFNAESQKYLIDWCLTGVMSKCRQTISLTWDGQRNMTKVHTETFLSPSVCCSCKMLLLSLPFHKLSKETQALLPTQHRENKHPLHWYRVCRRSTLLLSVWEMPFRERSRFCLKLSFVWGEMFCCVLCLHLS